MSQNQKASLVANQEVNYADGAADPYYYNYNPNAPSGNAPNAPPQQGFENDALKQRALELAKREEELLERERQLAKKEEDVVSNGAPKPNWPRCYPLVYHSLAGIEGKLRRTVAIMGYIGFFVFTLIIILNFVGAMIAVSPFISYGTTDDMGNSGRAKFGIMSALFILIAPIAHLALSYAPLYKAMHTVHIFWFLILFITYALPILFCAFCFAGWYEYGPCGLILMIVAIPASGRGNLTVFIVSCIMTALWALMGIYYLIIYILVLQVFRRENHTFKSARDFLKGSLVRGVSKAVTTGVTQVVSAQMSGGQAAEGSGNSV